MRSWKEKNKESNRVKYEEYRDRTREQRHAATKQWKKANPEKCVVYARKVWLKRYGLTLDQYEALSEAQGHKCAICFQSREKERARNLSVDHCHDSGAVRGLLCNDCNRNLIAQRNDPDIFLRAADYVRQSLRKAAA